MLCCVIGIAVFFFTLSDAGILNFSPQGAQEIETNRSFIKSRDAGERPSLKPILSIRNSPKDFMEIANGQMTYLECEAGGTPPPSIHWMKNGVKIPQNIYEALHPQDGRMIKSRLGLGFTRSRLFIDCATSGDSGAYTCVAENEYMKEQKTSQISVVDRMSDDNGVICLTKKSFGSPARVHMWTHTRLELMGTDVQLFCRADGDPQPQITWIGPNDKPLANSSKYQVLNNGDLVIRKISWIDMGGYVCQVNNSEGSDESSVFLYPTLPENNMNG